MPELPEVEVWRRRLDDRGLGRAVESVALRDREKLRQCMSPAEAEELLTGREFTESRRHGKHLFAGVSGDAGWLRLHFGMSGDLQFPDADHAWPDHACLRLTFRDGGRMAYVNVRKLGQIDGVPSVEACIETEGLGPDALEEARDREVFLQALEGRRGMVKSTLMNQEVLAGLGNEYTDEILCHAGIHPRTAVNELDREDREDLHRSLVHVLGAAIEVLEAGPVGEFSLEDLPDGFLLPRREEGAVCPRCGGTIERVDVSGRSAYFCADHQA